MRNKGCLARAGLVLGVLRALAASALAQTPAPTEASWIGARLQSSTPAKWHPELRLNYTTLGDPAGEPVLILHGTAGSGAGLLDAGRSRGELFGPDSRSMPRRYFIIIPDALGHGKSSKPSDGLRAKFPKYNYDDMVDGALPAA